jgi:nicotinamidase-related amidase/alkylated DNA repair dioxygenase AlkB
LEGFLGNVHLDLHYNYIKMFPFDQAALPHLTTRKALLAIDLQNDFLSSDGCLQITEPDGFVERIVKLAAMFRQFGDVVWVRSEFEQHRPQDSEQILVGELDPSQLMPLTSPRAARRSSGATKKAPPIPSSNIDSEAFLSQLGQGNAGLLKSATTSSELAPIIKEAVSERDLMYTKSHYSAFNSNHLVQMLRVKFVTELFVCGSLTNVGVYASVMDAAKHGFAITVVEDCCGFRDDSRQSLAIRNLIEITGCEVASCVEVMEQLQPKPKTTTKTKQNHSSPERHSRPPRTGESGRSNRSPVIRNPAASPGISNKVAALSLSDTRKSDEPQATGTQPQSPLGTEPLPALGSPAVDSEFEHLGMAHTGNSIPADNKYLRRREVLPDTSLNPDVPQEQQLQKECEEVSQRPPDDSSPNIMEDSEKSPNSYAKDPICEGDTTIIHNALPPALADGVFEILKKEVHWLRMSHQGGEVPRLVAVQGSVAGDGSQPIYRHPADESPPLQSFTPTVLKIKSEVEKLLGHSLNHVLIQFYRSGNDYISEHSDKTLDIVKGSFIANVSLGAERTMVFRTKRPDKDPLRAASTTEDTKRQVFRAALPHNSLCRMGLVTNMRWLHAIRQDKRADRDKLPSELAFAGGRISLTFRNIGTFMSKDSKLIWGQGATEKNKEKARPVVNGQTTASVRMLQAFGKENHSSEFDWDAHYGSGFDVLHMSNSPRLFLSSDSVVNNRVRIMLAELGIDHSKGSMASTTKDDGQPTSIDSPGIKFVDNDSDQVVVHGELAIMLYLDSVYGSSKQQSGLTQQVFRARLYSRFQEALGFLGKWRALDYKKIGAGSNKHLKKELDLWDKYASDAEFIAGDNISLADFAFGPVLHDVVETAGADVLKDLQSLIKYYGRFMDREATKKVIKTTESTKE